MGAVFEPSANFSAGFSYYQIKWTNQVAFPDFQSVINANDPANVFRDPAGNIYAVSGKYLNLGEV